MPVGGSLKAFLEAQLSTQKRLIRQVLKASYRASSRPPSSSQPIEMQNATHFMCSIARLQYPSGRSLDMKELNIMVRWGRMREVVVCLENTTIWSMRDRGSSSSLRNTCSLSMAVRVTRMQVSVLCLVRFTIRTYWLLRTTMTTTARTMIETGMWMWI